MDVALFPLIYILHIKSDSQSQNCCCTGNFTILSLYRSDSLKTLTGKEIEIDIEPTDKVDRIKERVEEKEGIPPQQQRLIFSGKQM